MAYYMSMQSVRFRSPNDYDRFKMLFRNVGRHLKQLEGFVHLTWWQHPDDPTWFNEISIWTSKQATEQWHNNGYHKYLKSWGLSGPIIEDIVTNWECLESKIMRLCPVCRAGARETFDLKEESRAKARCCAQCGFEFPQIADTASSFAVFRSEA
jgi:heme-degrading monooxygenase HmoA